MLEKNDRVKVIGPVERKESKKNHVLVFPGSSQLNRVGTVQSVFGESVVVLLDGDNERPRNFKLEHLVKIGE